jgi:transcription elongation GreA/GreB family factor
VSAFPPKTSLKEELLRVIAADLALRERTYRSAHEGATHAEAKPENDKDTRALEASYLARGEAARVDELRTALADVQAMPLLDCDGGPVRVGALVAAEEGGERSTFWVAPHGGGARLADGAVQVVTPKSPLGRALLGANAGDECEVVLAGRRRVMEIVEIS